MIARLALFAALAGSATGAAVVLADEPAPVPRPPAVKLTVSPREPVPPPIEARDPKILLQVADPEGGPAWAVRTFATRSGRKQTVARCYEIGRLEGKTFGWIDGHGRFKPTAPGRFESPGDCPSPGVLKALGATTGRFTTVNYSPTGLAVPARTITWGIAAPTVTAVGLNDEPPLSVNGPYLDVRTGDGALITRTTIERADGRRTTRDVLRHGGFRGERVLAGTSRVLAVAPDPAGGQPWAVLGYRGERGNRCFSGPGRLVGNRFGRIETRLDVLYGDLFELIVNCGKRPPTAAHPLRVDSLIGGDALDSQGRVERRIVDGRIVYWGVVHPDVVSVTITTPRDVRTLVPSKDHVFVAAYAGLFPGGKATATARLRDGREVTRSLHVE